MSVSGRFFAPDPFETYHAAAWGRRGRHYVAPRHTPMVQRWRAPRYGKGQHATVIWTDWLGRVRIARTVRAA